VIDDPTLEELRMVVEDAEPLLRDLWGRRKTDRDILVLADMRREECRPLAEQWWPPDFVRRFVEEAAAKQARPFLPYLQPHKLIELLSRGGWAQQQAAEDLTALTRLGAAVVPLWVVHCSGHWATCWAPPDSNVVVRYESIPSPENN
jgi:hypothetical protein